MSHHSVAQKDHTGSCRRLPSRDIRNPRQALVADSDDEREQELLTDALLSELAQTLHNIMAQSALGACTRSPRTRLALVSRPRRARLQSLLDDAAANKSVLVEQEAKSDNIRARYNCHLANTNAVHL